MFSDVMTLVFAVIAMIVVLYMSFVASKMLSQSGAKARTSKYMRIVDTVAMNKDRYFIIVNVGDRYFLTGVTEQRIENLCELNKDDLVELSNQKEQGAFNAESFKEVFGKLTGNGKDR